MIADTIWPTRLHYWSFSTSLSFANNKFLVYTAPPASCGYFFISLSKKIICHTAPKQLYFPTSIWNWTQKLLINRYLTNKTQTKSLKHNREPNVHYFAPNADLCGPLKKNPTHIFYMHILCTTLVILRGDSHALKICECQNQRRTVYEIVWTRFFSLSLNSLGYINTESMQRPPFVCVQSICIIENLILVEVWSFSTAKSPTW